MLKQVCMYISPWGEKPLCKCYGGGVFGSLGDSDLVHETNWWWEETVSVAGRLGSDGPQPPARGTGLKNTHTNSNFSPEILFWEEQKLEPGRPDSDILIAPGKVMSQWMRGDTPGDTAGKNITIKSPNVLLLPVILCPAVNVIVSFHLV